MELGSAKPKKKSVAGSVLKGKKIPIPTPGNAARRLEALRKLLAKRTAELIIAKKELRFRNTEKVKREGELIIARKEYAFQNKEKEKRAAELVIANIELVFQNNEKGKRAAELIVANGELVYQNGEKEKRAAELIIANVELVFQNEEKGKRAAELIVANGELVYQNGEKEKRAAELIIANIELVFQNDEKGKRAAELFIANGELVFQNEEKEKRAAELLNANSQLEAFNYVSSHDLQEPLRKIQMFVLRILETEHEKLSEDGKHCFSRIQIAVVRMRQLIRDLLAFSHLSIAEREFQNTDLNRIVDDVKAELKETIDEQRATIEATELCRLQLIPFQFRQLIHNLVGNSLKFSKPNVPPHVVITSSIGIGSVLNPGTEDFPAGRLLPEAAYCLIRFADNGIGFDSQYNDRIFEVFQRLHGKDQYAGTGIGLAIVKKIVENHNGIITVASVPDKGTTFSVYIPIVEPQPLTPHPSQIG